MCKNIRKLLLVKQEPVNLKHQTWLSIIPYVELYAFYRIQKLRRYILNIISIFITIYLVAFGIRLGVALVDSLESAASAYVDMIKFTESMPAYVISLIGTALINIYLVRKWSKKWNKQFEDNTKQINSQENVEN